jgi:hypothetical protein
LHGRDPLRAERGELGGDDRLEPLGAGGEELQPLAPF